MKKQVVPATSPKKKRNKAKRRLLISVAALGAVVLGVGISFAMLAAKGGGGIAGFTNALVGKLNQPENILLIGNNARTPTGPLSIAGGGGQADIMMIAHIDPAKHQVVLISIPRDTLFAMPQYNNPIPKLKTFFYIGAQMQPNQAAQLTVKAVEQFTGMHIDHWVVTDFQGFSDAINAIGGVRIYVPGRIYDPAHSGANFFKGWYTMNGKMALQFIRVRQNTASVYQVNDFQRDDAQGQLLSALQTKLLHSKNDLANMPGLISTWMKDVATDMSLQDLIRAAEAVHGAKMVHINIGNVKDSMMVASAPAPGLNQENYITGAFYDIMDSSKVAKLLKPYGSTGSSTGIPLPDPSTVPVQFYGSQSTADQLKADGFPVTWMGSGGTYPAQINYPPGDMAWGLQVGRALGTGNSVVQEGTSSGAVVVYAP